MMTRSTVDRRTRREASAEANSSVIPLTSPAHNKLLAVLPQKMPIVQRLTDAPGARIDPDREVSHTSDSFEHPGVFPCLPRVCAPGKRTVVCHQYCRDSLGVNFLERANNRHSCIGLVFTFDFVI